MENVLSMIHGVTFIGCFIIMLYSLMHREDKGDNAPPGFMSFKFAKEFYTSKGYKIFLIAVTLFNVSAIAFIILHLWFKDLF